MGGGMSLAENQEVSHESGAGRVLKSIVGAVCLAPLLMVGMVYLIGFNEQQAVCDAKALDAGAEAVLESGCSDPAQHSGAFVFFQCDIQRSGLQSLAPGGSFHSNFSGVGLKVKAEMYQCVEHAHKDERKDNLGGGKTTVTTYTYSKEWKDSFVDSHNFKKVGSANWQTNCGVHNPSWQQQGLPASGSRYAGSIAVGPYKVSDNIDRIPLETPVTFPTPPGWRGSGNSFSKGSGDRVGDARVSFWSNDWNHPTVTVVGKNDHGKITPWKSPPSWLCSGNSVIALKPGSRSKEAMLQSMRDEVVVRTWVLRFIGLLVLWFAFSLCFAPLGVAADCIPLLGPCLGDGIEMISCCVACLPATACCLGVAGVVWCAMRPLVGVPLMLVWIGVVCGYGFFIARSRAAKAEGSEPLAGPTAAPTYGTAQAVLVQPAAAAPAQEGLLAQPQRQMQAASPWRAPRRPPRTAARRRCSCSPRRRRRRRRGCWRGRGGRCRSRCLPASSRAASCRSSLRRAP